MSLKKFWFSLIVIIWIYQTQMKTLAVLLCILCLVTAGQGYFQFLRSSDQPPNLKFDPTNIQEVIFFTN